MHPTDKIFGNICLRFVRDTFLSNMWSVIRKRTGWLDYFWVKMIFKRRGKFKIFGLAGRLLSPTPPLFPPLLGHADLPITKILMKVLGLFTLLILKRVSESIFFQGNKFTACKVIDEKEVTHSFMVFNLLKIGLFQKKPSTVGLGYTFLKPLPRFQTKKTSSLETQHDCIIPLENFKA